MLRDGLHKIAVYLTGLSSVNHRDTTSMKRNSAQKYAKLHYV